MNTTMQWFVFINGGFVNTTMQWFVFIAETALLVLKGLIPGGSAGIGIAEAAIRIAQAANAVHQAETGQPIDLNKVPPIDLIP